MVHRLRLTSEWILAGVIVLLFLFPANGTQTNSFTAKISGSKSFTLRYGIGDPQGLGQAGISPYQLDLDQSLAVDVTADALSILTLKGHFNDKEPASMQSLTLHLHADKLSGVFGDFSISGKEAFAVYNKKLKGVRLDYTLPGGGVITGVLSQIEGISESKTFIGHSAHGEVLFSFSFPDRPWLTQPYTRNLAGLYYYTLTAPYIEGFSEVDLAFAVSGKLRAILKNYGLGYLAGTIEASPANPFPQGTFTVVHDKSDFLILMRRTDDILRTQLLDYIKTYNINNNLTGKDKKEYPFNTGSNYEKAFLHALSKFVAITVDENSYPLLSGNQHRFYYLGHKNVKKGSIEVTVSVNGATFRPITAPDLSSDYRMSAFPDQGIIAVSFPADFFSGSKSAMRVTFSYSMSGNAYSLGLSIVPGSDKVYLNGKLLKRNTDYTIDYDVGLLILLTKVKDSDTIRIDYERARGGLGSTAEYARNFYGTSVDIPVSNALSLEASVLQAADSPTSRVNREKARTMPNTHTVSGIIGHVKLDGFNANFTLGYNTNRFPLDDDERVNIPNKITAIAVASDYTFFANTSGVSVYHDGNWSAYTTANGLSGNRVYAIASTENRVLFGTGSGLTVLTLTGEAPLDQVANWKRYSVNDGLPNAAVHALAIAGDKLWVGTEAGIAEVPLDKMDDPKSWHSYTAASIIKLGAITALAVDSDHVYVGCTHGLFSFDPVTGTLQPLPGMSGVNVTSLVMHNGALYAGCDLGLRSFYRGTGNGWLVFGTPVYAVAFAEGKVWYGGNDGLYRTSAAGPAIPGETVTAIAPDPTGGVWVGTRADSDYNLLVFHVDAHGAEPFANTTTKIDGRDPTRFADIPADKHTDRGGIAQASFTRSMGPFVLSGTFVRISPQFTAIGRLSRQDVTGWTLNGKANLPNNLTISAIHGYHLIDTATPQQKKTMDNAVSLAWKFGPQFSFSVNHSLVDDDQDHPGFDSGKLTYKIGLSDKLFADAISLGLVWNDGFIWNFASTLAPRRDTRLDLTGTWHVLSGLSVSGTWSRPVSFIEDRRIGADTWTGGLAWSGRLATAALTANYNITAHHTVGSDRINSDQGGKIRARLDKFGVAAWKVIPAFTAAFAKKAGIVTASGEGNINLTYSDFSVSGNYTHTVSGLGNPRNQLTDRLSLLFSYTGIPDLRPSLAYTMNKTAVVYKGVAKPTVNHSLTGHLSYRPASGITDDLALSARASAGRRENLTINLTNTFTYPILEQISSRLVLTGRYMQAGVHPQLNLSLRGGVDVTLSNTWSGSLSASYLTGLKSTGGLYNSLLLALTITATF